jgi:hypothetical protein
MEVRDAWTTVGRNRSALLSLFVLLMKKTYYYYYILNSNASFKSLLGLDIILLVMRMAKCLVHIIVIGTSMD